MSTTPTGTKQPCESERINTRRHCTLHLEDGTRCRKYARCSCPHGLHCEEHDIFLHTVTRRAPGDFICRMCGEHFLDKEGPEVSEHIGAHAERAADSNL